MALTQLSLFPQKKCDWCGNMVGTNQCNPNIFNGFRDAGTGMFVCWPCKPTYYLNNKVKVK
jgi:hypothetical protein